MNEDDFPMDDHHLDERIRAALGVETTRAQLERLEGFWHGRRHAQRRRRALARAVGWAVALAASVLVAVVAWQWPARNEHVAQIPAQIVRHGSSHDPSPSRDREGAVGVAVVASRDTPHSIPLPHGRGPDFGGCGSDARRADAMPPPCSRPPTVYEQVVFLAHERRSRAAQPRSKPSVATEIAAAVKAAQQIKQAQPLAQFVAGTKSAEVRAALLRRLLAGDSETAVRGYLLLVADRTTRDETLRAATSVSGPLLERLLALLEDKDRATRLAAAMVLGHVDGPEVANALVGKVQEQPRRSTEAWIALLACRGDRVETFLAQVKYDSRYVGPLNRARAEWARLTM